MIGLRLGRQNDAIPSGPAKRSRASHQNMQNPRCQVEGCNFDLMSAKDYHRRNRICEGHSKSPKVIVAGMERRFCQQCSRFHDLSEFDDKKRSCRRRLSDHNARRRRVQPESVHLGPTRMSSAFYDQRQGNLLLNGHSVSHSSSNFEAANTYMFRQDIIRPSKIEGFEGTPCYSSDEIRLQIPITSSPIASDLLSAHSLLSSYSWSLNEDGNYNPRTSCYHGP